MIKKVNIHKILAVKNYQFKIAAFYFDPYFFLGKFPTKHEYIVVLS